jgi:hypothetical protein
VEKGRRFIGSDALPKAVDERDNDPFHHLETSNSPPNLAPSGRQAKAAAPPPVT